MSDVYQTPESNLVDDATGTVGSYGSLEKAVSGDYEFQIGATISEAWEKTAGSKWTLWAPTLLYIVVMLGVTIVLGIVVGVLIATSPADSAVTLIVNALVQLCINLFTLPIVIGVMIIGIRCAVDLPNRSGSIFSHFSRMIPLFITMLLMYVMLIIGFLLLVLPGIYLAVAYYMALPLVVEKGLSPWQALETSRKTVTHRWFSVFGFFLLMGLIMLVSAIPLGIGLIWTVPLFMISYGILYRNMFGVENKEA